MNPSFYNSLNIKIFSSWKNTKYNKLAFSTLLWRFISNISTSSCHKSDINATKLFAPHKVFSRAVVLSCRKELGIFLNIKWIQIGLHQKSIKYRLYIENSLSFSSIDISIFLWQNTISFVQSPTLHVSDLCRLKLIAYDENYPAFCLIDDTPYFKMQN